MNMAMTLEKQQNIILKQN